MTLSESFSRSTNERIAGRRSVARSVPLVTGVVLLTLLLSTGAVHGLAQDVCHEVDIPSVFLARSGAWSGDDLVILDVLKRRFLKFDTATRATEFLWEGNWRHPASMKQHHGDILVLDEGAVSSEKPGPASAIVRFDGRMDATEPIVGIEGRSLAPLADALGPQPVLQSIYDWHPLGDGILAFGDISVGAGDWKSAFLYVDEDGRQQAFVRLSPDAQVCNQYTTTSDYIAALDGRGYLLFLDPVPKIAEVIPDVGGVRELPGFPEDFQSRPRLDTRPRLASTRQGARQATIFYEILEASTMAAGIYGWGNHLYLLGKEAIDPTGNTDWSLVKLDPDDGSELSRVRLPTEAAHLTVVPGPEFWAFVERGQVQGIGERHAPYMETSSLVLVPTAWIENPKSNPQLNAEVQCIQSRINRTSSSTAP